MYAVNSSRYLSCDDRRVVSWGVTVFRPCSGRVLNVSCVEPVDPYGRTSYGWNLGIALAKVLGPSLLDRPWKILAYGNVPLAVVIAPLKRTRQAMGLSLNIPIHR